MTMTFRDPTGRRIDPDEYASDPYGTPSGRAAASELQRIKEEPRVIGTVAEIRGDRMSLSLGFPPLVDVRSIKDAAVGDRVLLNRNTMAPLDVIKDKVPTGMVLTVERIDGDMVQCYKESTLKAFRCAALKVRKGERVIIDACDANVIGSLGMPPPSFLFAPRVDVSWDDIGGQEEAKEALRDAIELPFAQPALFKAYGKKHCKGVMLYGPSGCIAGDMHVPYSIHDRDGRKQNCKGGGFEHLYRRFNGIPTSGKGFYQRPQTVGSRYFVPSMNEDGKIFRNEIDAVIDSGVKKCVRLRTASGLELVCTHDHPIATANGYFPAASFEVGAMILTHQNVKWTAGDEERRRVYRPEVFVKNHPTARTKIVRTSSGDYEYKRLTRARAVYEANLNGIDLSSYVKLLNDGSLDGLVFADPNVDIHHIDENPLHDVPDNLVALSHADHAAEHMDTSRAQQLAAHVAVEDAVESIEEVGERHTYDIRMKSAPHNFVTAGFVVHNTGKTLISKAAATANGRAHGKNGGAFIYVKGPELLNKWVGNSEQAVRSLFDAAREHKLQHGDPALIFIDEADALLGARDQGMHTGTAATGVVQQFLAEMDGLEETASIMILATNRPDIIDPAVTRDGRIDRKVRVTRPTREDSARIFDIHLASRPLAGDGHIERAVDELFADTRIVRDLGDRIYVRLRDMVSGAMIAGVVEQATTAAIRRDMIGKGRKASGVTVDDLVFAIDRAQRGVKDTNHGEVVKELIEAARDLQLAESTRPSA